MRMILLFLSMTVSAVEIFPEFIDRQNPNGWLQRDHNQVTYTSHRPGYQHGQDCEKHYCRKSDSLYMSTPWTQGRVTITTFNLRINKYNQYAAPEWIILFQDWMLIDENDKNGNHPITTIKLKPMSNGRIKLGHFENSWQFDYFGTSTSIIALHRGKINQQIG